MYRKGNRALAIGLTAAMLLSQAVYADSVVTAQTPDGVESGSYISSTGPTGTKELSSSGYLVVGQSGNVNSYVNAGPGVVGTITGTGTNSNSNGGQVTVIGTETTTSAADTSTAAPTATTTAGTAAVTDTSAAAAQTGTAGQITISTSVTKPTVSSEAAILYDATTGQTLYAKNENKVMYPASTTKLMTALLAAEKLSMSDTVTYSSTATQNLESGASNVQLTTGDTLSVQDSMYALLLKSACEVANGLAEKVSGTQEAFAALMNQRAKELGCLNTNFVNASGLNNASHYTTVYDMALITKAALDNETVRKIDQTITYTLPASKNRSSLTITNGHKMINPSDSRYYQGIIGGKTGYTSKAGNTLATAASINGREVIAVVFKSSQKQYDDTKALFDYAAQLYAAAGVTGTGTAAATTTTSGTATGTSASSTSADSTAQGWIQVSDTQWQYRKANGNLCKSEWLDLSSGTYWFDDDTYMATGWRHFSNGAWYYFNPQNGTMVTEKWVTDNGKSYYMQADGTMATSTVINNTYRVDENGVYVEKLQ